MLDNTVTIKVGSSLLKCPLSGHYLTDPIVLSCGHTFDKTAFSNYEPKNSCPVCSKEIDGDGIENHRLKSIISENLSDNQSINVEEAKADAPGIANNTHVSLTIDPANFECPVGSEYFHQACLINCGHTLEEKTLNDIKNEDSLCPECRVAITSSRPCYVFDALRLAYFMQHSSAIDALDLHADSVDGSTNHIITTLKANACFDLLLQIPDLDIGIDAETCHVLLHRYTTTNQLDALQALVQQVHYLDINQPDAYGHTPLMLAVQHGHIAIVEYLITIPSINLNVINPQGNRTALHWAVEKAKENIWDCLRILLQAGADPTIQAQNSILYHVLMEREPNLNLIKYFTEYAVAPSYQVDLGSLVPDSGETLLHHHAIQGNVDAIKCLVIYGTDINQINAQGFTALHWALLNKKTDVINIFLTLHSAEDILPILNMAILPNDQTLLHHFAIEGYLEGIKWLKRSGANLNQTDAKGNTALMLAVQHGHKDVVKYLAKRSDLTLTNPKNGHTILHWAVQKKLWEYIPTLLDAGADPTIQAMNYRTAFHNILISGDPKGMAILKQLPEDQYSTILNMPIQKKGQTLLHHFAIGGKLDGVRRLVGLGLDINQTDEQGNSALMLIIQNKSEDFCYTFLTLERVMNLKINLNLQTHHNGYTALHWTVEKKQWNCILALLSVDADPMIQARDGCTAFHHLLISGNPEGMAIWEQLPEELRKTILNMPIQENKQALLHYFAIGGNIEGVQRLVYYGVDINQTDDQGNTPLMLARRYGHSTIVSYLTRPDSTAQSSNPESLDESKSQYLIVGSRDTLPNGQKLVHWCSTQGYLGRLSILLEHKPNDCNLPDVDGNTPLILAVKNGHSATVSYLVNLEIIQLNLANNNGYTALNWAVQENQVECIEILLKAGADPTIQTLKGHSSILYNVLTKKSNKTLIPIFTKSVQEWVRYKIDWGDCTLPPNDKALLHHFVIQGNLEAIKCLVAYGTNINLPDADGCTPLILAVQHEHVHIVKYLLSLEGTIDVKLTTRLKNYTALHWAVEKNWREEKNGRNILYYLLKKAKIALMVQDRQGSTFLHLLLLKKKQNNHLLQTVAIFLKDQSDGENIISYISGLPIYECNRTILHKFAIDGYKAGIQWLIERGADINKHDTQGNTPLMLARRYGHKEIASYLATGQTEYKEDVSDESALLKKRKKPN